MCEISWQSTLLWTLLLAGCNGGDLRRASCRLPMSRPAENAISRERPGVGGRVSRSAAVLLGLAVALAACKGKDDVEARLKSRWALSADATRWTTLTVPSSLTAVDGGFEVFDVKPGSGEGRPGLHSSLLIHVLWPDMSGHTARDADEFDVPGGGRSLTIALRSPAIDVIGGKPFDAFALERRIAFDSLENVCVPTGRPVPGNVVCTHRPPSVEREEFGLHLFGRDFATYPIDSSDFVSQQEILEGLQPDGTLKSLIRCTPDAVPANLAIVPHCSMFFLDKRLNAVVETHFRKIYLPEWMSIRQKVESLVATFSKE